MAKIKQHSEKLTEAIYIEVSLKSEESKDKRRVCVSGMLKYLGISRSGYNAWY